MWKTYILIRNNLDTLNMTGRFKDLFQNVLSDPGIQSSDVESAFVRLGRGATDEATAGGRRGDTRDRHGRGDSRGDRVRVLRDDHLREGRGWHVAAGSRVVLAWGRSGGLLLARDGVLSISRHFGRSTMILSGLNRGRLSKL